MDPVSHSRTPYARTFENIEGVLSAAGKSLDDVVKATVSVMDMDNYDDVNDVYGEYMSDIYPARSAVQVEGLPVDINRETDECHEGFVFPESSPSFIV